ncbi:MAG: hypothetical protein SGBAC_004099 [Bacillariaceae sp.]
MYDRGHDSRSSGATPSKSWTDAKRAEIPSDPHIIFEETDIVKIDTAPTQQKPAAPGITSEFEADEKTSVDVVGAISVLSDGSEIRPAPPSLDKTGFLNRSPAIPEDIEADEANEAMTHSLTDSGDVTTVPLEATTAPDMTEEIEAALQKGREEERNARAQQETSPVFVATPVQDNSSRKYKYGFAAFAVFAIATGVIFGLLVPRESSVSRSFAPPTAGDCLAVSQGIATEGQNETTSKTFGLEINLVVGSDIDIEFLQTELDANIQSSVLPLLVGCKMEGPFSIEYNIYIIENAILKSTSVSGPAACISNSEGLCSNAYFELDVFSKNDDELDQTVLRLVTDVFQYDGILELLNLTSPVTAIDNTTQTCDAIGSGAPISGQESLVVEVYDILMDVMMDSEKEELSLITDELKWKLQSVLLPSLVGCTDNGRRLRSATLILNALIDGEVQIHGSCLPDAEVPCYRYVIRLDIYVEPTTCSPSNVLEVISAGFREAPLIERLGLVAPFKNIIFVDIVPRTDSISPSPSGEYIDSEETSCIVLFFVF